MNGWTQGSKRDTPRVELLLHVGADMPVRHRLGPLGGDTVKRISDADSQVYYVGEFAGRTTALVVSTGHSSGLFSTYNTVSEALRTWNPTFLVSLGLAPGVYHDVIVANRVGERCAGTLVERVDRNMCVGPVLSMEDDESAVFAVDSSAMGIAEACAVAKPHVEWLVVRCADKHGVDRAIDTVAALFASL